MCVNNWNVPVFTMVDGHRHVTCSSTILGTENAENARAPCTCILQVVVQLTLVMLLLVRLPTHCLARHVNPKIAWAALSPHTIVGTYECLQVLHIYTHTARSYICIQQVRWLALKPRSPLGGLPTISCTSSKTMQHLPCIYPRRCEVSWGHTKRDRLTTANGM